MSDPCRLYTAEIATLLGAGKCLCALLSDFGCKNPDDLVIWSWVINCEISETHSLVPPVERGRVFSGYQKRHATLNSDQLTSDSRFQLEARLTERSIRLQAALQRYHQPHVQNSKEIMHCISTFAI